MKLQAAKDAADSGHYDKAWPIINQALFEEPDDPKFLTLASFIYEKQGHVGAAYQVAKRLTTMHPNNPAAWLNLGKCADTLWRMDEAEAAYRRALNQVKAGDDETKGLIFNNLAAMYLQLGEFDKARSASEKALKIDPNHLKARHNMGLCHLAAGEWKEGWKLYEASIGSPHRIAWNYTGEPAWKGEPDGTVVIFGEQGIGVGILAGFEAFADIRHDFAADANADIGADQGGFQFIEEIGVEFRVAREQTAEGTREKTFTRRLLDRFGRTQNDLRFITPGRAFLFAGFGFGLFLQKIEHKAILRHNKRRYGRYGGGTCEQQGKAMSAL